ncbi:flagellar protein FlaG [Nitrosomonas sp. sh817]|jgi:flagellar protein FlaG|uniref:flagellar protein FlaG n=1 Tax=Nitrosomonas sp. sh817 TaxID=3070658 RepID=UPI0027DC1A90|nr:flagellar protein FlaG [Nitrosomonas sp. sh817]WMJ09782.1 flagellar protein FlaG [Nitrosomonas sp. sh817]
MTISQLNGTSLSPVPSLTTSTTKKMSASNTENIAMAASIVGSKIGNSMESEEQVKQAVQKIQGTVNNLAQNLQFSIDEDTGKTIIKVMDVHTEEVIRQIPTEEAVEIARTLDKVQGLLFNGKA